MFIDESEVLNSLFLLCCFCFLSLWLFVFALYIELLLYWVHACLCAKSLQCCLTDPMDCSLHGIFRQEYWSGLPCPPPGNLLHPGIKPASPAFQADFFYCCIFEDVFREKIYVLVAKTHRGVPIANFGG